MAGYDKVQRAWLTLAEAATRIISDREVIVVTDDYSLLIGDGSTTGGRTRLRGEPAGAVPYSAPSSGATITTASGERVRVVDPAATIAALTITLPPSPPDGHVWEGSTSQAITALTVTAAGATVLGGSFLAPANSGFSWRYVAANAHWYRRY